jgi:hypothetical protein
MTSYTREISEVILDVLFVLMRNSCADSEIDIIYLQAMSIEKGNL